MEEFSLKPKIYLGKNSLDALSGLKAGRVLVVTDPFWSGGGVSQIVGRISGQVEVFDGVTGEPDTTLCAAGVQAFQRFQPQAIVALGGGSVLDCAKAVRKFATQEGEEQVPLWAIPTTAGTGSEVTSFAVITHQGGKIPLVEDSLLPEVAILAGELLGTLPPKAVADTGMDALSHGIESYVSTGGNPFTQGLAECAVGMCWQELPRAMAGEGDSREKMLAASSLAGAAFNSSGLGICHSLAHALGGTFHLPHGRLNSALLPTVVRFNAGLDVGLTSAAQGYAQLAQRCGLTTSGGRAGVFAFLRGLARLQDKLGLPKCLGEAGIPREGWSDAIPKLAQGAMEDVCTATNPRPVTQGELEQLLREAF
jgi:1-propanol dehydrogenase